MSGSETKGRRIQGTLTSGMVRKEDSPQIDTSVAKSFLDLLKDVRQPLGGVERRYEFQSTPELEVRITGVLDAACA